MSLNWEGDVRCDGVFGTKRGNGRERVFRAVNSAALRVGGWHRHRCQFSHRRAFSTVTKTGDVATPGQGVHGCDHEGGNDGRRGERHRIGATVDARLVVKPGCDLVTPGQGVHGSDHEGVNDGSRRATRQTGG